MLANVVEGAQFVGQCPGLLLGQPHQRRADVERIVHGQIQRDIHRLDEHVPAVRIAAEVGFAHAGVQGVDALALGVDGGIQQKQRIAPVHEGVGRLAAVLLDGDAAVQ